MRTRPVPAAPPTPPAPRSRTTMHILSVAAWVLGLLPVLAAAPASADDGGPFEQVYAARARLVCRIPASGNAQRTTGYDGGASFVYDGIAYWSVGDSDVDVDGDGVFNPYTEPLGFRPGSIGRASTTRPGKCVAVTLRTTNGRNVLPALTPDVANNECTYWPNQVFEADSKLYFFFGIYKLYPSCQSKNPTAEGGIGLGRLTNPTSYELGPVREGTAGDFTYYLSPLKLGSFIYLFRVSSGELYAARVNEQHVPSRSHYEYWTGPDTRWGVEANAVPFATLEQYVGAPRIAFNEYIGRFMMIYSCNTFRDLCARTAKLPGATLAAFEGGWHEKTVLLDIGLSAYGTWHPSYKDPQHPERIYLSTARFPGRAYFVTWWEVDLAAQPPPASRSLHYAGRDLFRHGPGNDSPWNYGTYDLAAPGGGLSVGTLVPGQGPPHPNPDLPLQGYVGSEMVGGVSAPGAGPTVVWPSESRGGAIVWTAPASGTAQISGAMWLERTLGDNGFGDIFIVRGGSVVPIWSKRLVAKWRRTRQRILNRTVSVQAGDRIVFGARKGKLPTSTALHDMAFVDVTITLDRS